MRTCVIFNPTARGDKARRFRRHLDELRSECTLKLTAAAGDARRLATEAVAEGYEVVAAAGGDGTVNEVLNGLGDAPEGFKRACLAVLPLGTVNVFARELGLPTRVALAWKTLCQGREARIDLPCIEYEGARGKERRYFAQLAGAGLDARAIELVRWELKKKLGPLAYVLAGLHALQGPPAQVTVSGGGYTATGALVLLGNGRLYGGQYQLFPKADLRDGLLEVCAFPRVNWLTLLRCGPPLLLRGRVPAAVTQCFQAESLTLTSPAPVPLEADGELIGRLPARCGVERTRLRVIVA